MSPVHIPLLIKLVHMSMHSLHFCWIHASKLNPHTVKHLVGKESILRTMFAFIILKMYEFAPKKTENDMSMDSIFENSDESIWLVNHKYKLIFFNKAFCKHHFEFYGTKLSYKANMIAIIPDIALKNTWKTRYDLILKEGVPKTYFDVFPFTDGDRHFEVKLNPVIRQGLVVGTSVFSKEITEYEKTRNSLVQINGELFQSNKKLVNFTYHASHELRAPISTALGLVNISRYNENPPETDYYLSLIEVQVKQLDRLLTDLRKVSENDFFPIEFSHFDLKKLVEEMLLKFKANQENVIEVNINIENEFKLYSDAQRLKTILTHLFYIASISNRKSLKRHKIQFETANYDKGRLMEINVELNNIWFSKDEIEQLFDIFYRPTNSNASLGLSLYIIKSIVERLNGNVRIESKAEEFTKLTFTLPSNSN